MKRFIYILWQSVWGIPQMMVGLILLLVFGRKRTSFYKGSVIVRWKLRNSASLGIFLFISDSLSEGEYKRMLVHEFGHSVQSLILGPLYLPLISLPSAVWCGLPLLRRYREKNGISYYSFYTERWADLLGERYKEKEMIE